MLSHTTSVPAGGYVSSLFSENRAIAPHPSQSSAGHLQKAEMVNIPRGVPPRQTHPCGGIRSTPATASRRSHKFSTVKVVQDCPHSVTFPMNRAFENRLFSMTPITWSKETKSDKKRGHLQLELYMLLLLFRVCMTSITVYFLGQNEQEMIHTQGTNKR